jgi:KaiC/GvpD/RAD55 family RecA-like ATPase
MLAGIKAEADSRGARRIVFDAVDALLSLLDDPLAERREIYRLDDWLSESSLTGSSLRKAKEMILFRRRVRFHAVHGGLRGRP